jgi:hypothetical protein
MFLHILKKAVEKTGPVFCIADGPRLPQFSNKEDLFFYAHARWIPRSFTPGSSVHPTQFHGATVILPFLLNLIYSL